jgi:ribosomal protein L20A (L18A)
LTINTGDTMNKAYQVEGEFQMGRIRQHFVLQVVAADEKSAADRVHATLGSRHGVTRRQVAIASTKALGSDQITDASTRVELRTQGAKAGAKHAEKPHPEKADRGHDKSSEKASKGQHGDKGHQ